MKEKKEAHFPRGADVVIRMFTDEDYFLKKYEMTGATNIELINVTHEGDQFSIEVRRDMPADVPLPGFAKKFVSDTMAVVQKDNWDTSSLTGRLDIDIKGLPVDVGCNMKLVDGGDSATLQLEFEANSSVPLLAKKIERLILDDILAKFDADTSAGVELLANY